MPLFLQIAYVTVAGKYLKGAPLRAKDATWGQKAVGAGYAQVPVHSALWENRYPLSRLHEDNAVLQRHRLLQRTTSLTMHSSAMQLADIHRRHAQSCAFGLKP